MARPNEIIPLIAEGGEPTAPAPGPIGEVANWLMDQALADTDLESLYDGCCARLRAVGIPLCRGHIAYSILHPLYGGMGLTWLRGRGVEVESYAHSGDEFPERFVASPLNHMIETRIPFLRRRLVGEGALLDYPMLLELRDLGVTDYLGFLIPFGDDQLDGMVGSWATDRASGFSDWDIASLQRIQQRLGVACKMRIKDQIARNVVTAYLGADAGLRVLSGQIKRGDGERLQAAIWYSDLRDSTGLAESLSTDDFIQLLSDYFECTGGAVLAQGGEVMNFIGDAVLAIFAVRKGRMTARQACARALAAGRDAQRRLSATNQRRRTRGLVPLSFGLGLHFGEMLFGNIGMPQRVSFSVIGPAVNQVTRLEALTKKLKRPILASEQFANKTSAEWVPRGRHKLRGIRQAAMIYAPAENAEKA